MEVKARLAGLIEEVVEMTLVAGRGCVRKVDEIAF